MTKGSSRRGTLRVRPAHGTCEALSLAVRATGRPTGNLDFRKRPLARAVGAALGLSAVTFGVPMMAHAEEAAVSEEVIIVTGSRIPRPNLTEPTAVTTIDSEAIEQSGVINVADVLRSVPSFGGSALSTNNSNFLTSGSGINTLELRNLEEDRTLVLVNGRRYVSGVPGSAAVDFNTIPTALIDRVEVITGGASAIYGSDALAGVINVILKEDFEGVELSYQYGESTEGGDIQDRITFTAGGDFADGRGNAVVSATYSDQKGLLSRKRDNTAVDDLASCYLIDATCETSITPVYSSFSEYGRFNVPSTGAAYTVIDGTGPDGTVVPFSSARYGFNRQYFRRYTVPTERYLVSANLNYDVSDTVNSFVEATFAQTRTQSELEPFPHSNSDLDASGTFAIPVDNPFVPQELRNIVLAAGDDTIQYRRRMTEVGQRGSDATRDTYRVVFGFEGSIADRWNWETFYSYGRMDDAQQGGGQINVPNMREALTVIDGDGNPRTFDPICANEIARLEGCEPVNLFGKGAISADAADYIRAPSSRQQLTQQESYGATLAGPLFDLPAGSVDFAIGYEFREERSEDVPDVLTQAGLNAGNAEAPTYGKYDVNEGYIEVEVPLLADQTLIDELSIGGAYRYSDYSTVGSTDAYTGRLSWAPTEALRFRVQYAKAVRAPNINELFAPGGENFAPVSDPCDDVTATTPGDIATNCRSIPAIAARIAAEGVFDLTQPEIQGTGGFTGKGNGNLDTETSDSWTYGVVYDEDFGRLGAMTWSVDYFEIEIEDLIDTVDRQTSVDFCYNTPPSAFPNQFCSFLTRDTTGPAFELGELTEVNSGFVNEGTLETEGVDVALQWSWVPADWVSFIPGDAAFGLNYTYLLDFTETKFGVEDELVEEVGYAEHKWRASFDYGIGAWSGQILWTYIDDSMPDKSSPGFDFHVGEYSTYDLQLGFDFAESGLMQGTLVEGARIYAGLKNMFDEDAPAIYSGVPGNTTGTDTNAVYDPVGRAWYAGMSVKF